MNNKTDDTQYLVYSREHNLWWRPNGCGYTFHISEAGRYSRDEAEKYCASRSPFDEGPPEFAVLAPENAERIEQLQRERDEWERKFQRQCEDGDKAWHSKLLLEGELERLRAAIEGAIDLINRAFAQSFHKHMFAAINEAKDKLSEALGAGD